MSNASAAIEVPELPDTELPGVKPIRGRFENKNVLEALAAFYPANEIEKMKEAGVDKRMVFGINSYTWRW